MDGGVLRLRDDNGNLTIELDASSPGSKSFLVPHPEDGSRAIAYACIEGPELAAYVRGVGTLVKGRAVVSLPEHFQLVTVAEGMTVQVTPLSANSKGLAVVRADNKEFEVVELSSGVGEYDFSYFVQALRTGHERFEVLRERQQAKSIRTRTALP